MDSHIPGPWHWGQNFNGLFNDKGDEVISYDRYEGSWLAHCDQREVNAKLIASAPDLLKLLKDIRGWDHLPFTHDGPFWIKQIDEIVEKIEG